MDNIPILKIRDFLLVTIQVDICDQVAIKLQDELTSRVVEDHSKGVLIDISQLEMVDSFIGRILGNIASMTRVLGAETVVVGIQPAVAITIVELGLDMQNVLTALNVDKGIALLSGRNENIIVINPDESL